MDGENNVCDEKDVLTDALSEMNVVFFGCCRLAVILLNILSSYDFTVVFRESSCELLET